MYRWSSSLILFVALLGSNSASAAELRADARLEAGVKVSDIAAPVSLLEVELRPSFGRHGFAQTQATFGASRDAYVAEVRFVPYRYDLGWVAFRAGGAGYDYKPLVETRTARLDLGGVDFRLERTLSGRLGVFATTSATFSIAQWTQSSLDPLTDIGFELFLCGSASRLEGELGLVLDEAWALVATAGLQGDPVHFTDGANCMGDPPAFSSKQQAGVELRYAGQSFYTALRGGWEQEGLHIDRASEYFTGVEHDHSAGEHGHDIVDVSSKSALIASAAVGIRW